MAAILFFLILAFAGNSFSQDARSLEHLLKGEIRVFADVDSADVFLDGTRLTRTKLDTLRPYIIHDVSFGEHTVELANEFWEPRAKKVDVKENGKASVEFRFEGKGFLLITQEGEAKWSGCEVEGNSYTSGERIALRPGLHKVHAWRWYYTGYRNRVQYDTDWRGMPLYRLEDVQEQTTSTEEVKVIENITTIVNSKVNCETVKNSYSPIGESTTCTHWFASIGFRREKE